MARPLPDERVRARAPRAGVVLSALAWVVDRVARRRPSRRWSGAWSRSSRPSSPTRTGCSARTVPIPSYRDERVLRVSLALLAVVAVTVNVLGDMTQTRPDDVNEDSETESSSASPRTASGSARRRRRRVAGGLLAATSSRMTGDGRLDALGDGQYRAVLRPAVGKYDERQLVGCLEDLTVDRVLATSRRSGRTQWRTSQRVSPRRTARRASPGEPPPVRAWRHPPARRSNAAYPSASRRSASSGPPDSTMLPRTRMCT